MNRMAKSRQHQPIDVYLPYAMCSHKKLHKAFTRAALSQQNLTTFALAMRLRGDRLGMVLVVCGLMDSFLLRNSMDEWSFSWSLG